MGIDEDFGRAYAKAQRAAGMDLPMSGTVLVSVRDEDKPEIAEAVQILVEEGFRVLATRGSAKALAARGISAEVVNKVPEGPPHTVDAIRKRAVDLVISTTLIGDAIAVRDSASMRRAALEHGVSYFTTAAGARAAAEAIRAMRRGDVRPIALQDVHAS
jgi:carbamoyl-phosphate synthase large subunit